MKKRLTYEKVVRFTNDFDYLCSDGYLLEILQGKININKMKSFIINYDGKPKSCSEIYQSPRATLATPALYDKGVKWM